MRLIRAIGIIMAQVKALRPKTSDTLQMIDNDEPLS